MTEHSYEIMCVRHGVGRVTCQALDNRSAVDLLGCSMGVKFFKDVSDLFVGYTHGVRNGRESSVTRGAVVWTKDTRPGEPKNYSSSTLNSSTSCGTPNRRTWTSADSIKVSETLVCGLKQKTQTGTKKSTLACSHRQRTKTSRARGICTVREEREQDVEREREDWRCRSR